ncbi:cytochrome c biogenesis protein CcdA, partial [Alphaproteobacteria bacterium]|nr:cytochrome c biogenesis protein CcdA [Alphaproteobacteria bacterium]
MVQDIPLTIAFLAGILSFLSPCVLPIVPGFISYIVGKSFADLENSSGVSTLKLLPYVLLFTLGFSFVFIIMGASIDFLSDIFFDFKKQLNFISGILIIILGLYFIGIIKIPFLDFERKFKLQGFQNNLFFPFLIGVA